ncbi:MerR family transcriptional regulator [Nonomuraea longicatena]|uniref:MerR family transcriptional regulator n=1 Tax=Nonomuraea longicatena TaxID=83682 RepID=A0ABN1NN19_9ACTN
MNKPLTIGQLAQRTGVSVRTIRFWSDHGLVPPTSRSHGGYRLYDVTAVARLDLVRTLRELGFDLATVERVLRGQDGLTEVARTHAAALDAEIRILKTRRAVLRSIVARDGSAEELRLMNELARLSATERQAVIDDFVEEVFSGLDPEAQVAGLGAAMRRMPAELPDEPSAEQVDAWVELAKLVADPGFRERVRTMAVTPPGPMPVDAEAVGALCGRALADGLAPDDPRAREVLDRLVDPALPADARLRLARDIETFTDRRVERYWQLLGMLNGLPAFTPGVPAFEWFIAALRAHI